MKNKALLILAFLFLFFAGLLLFANREAKEEQVACTMDAKLCPDGSYVGRVPPDCEFAPCPGE